jgi:hypothetical protein
LVNEFKYNSFLLALIMVTIGKVYAGFDFKHTVNTGAALEHVFISDKPYSTMTYIGGTCDCFQGYLSFSKE